MKRTLTHLALLATLATAITATVQAYVPAPSCFPCGANVSDDPIGQIPPPAR